MLAGLRSRCQLVAMQNLEALTKMSADDLGVSLGQFRRNLLLEITKLKILHGKEDGRIALKPFKKKCTNLSWRYSLFSFLRISAAILGINLWKSAESVQFSCVVSLERRCWRRLRNLLSVCGCPRWCGSAAAGSVASRKQGKRSRRVRNRHAAPPTGGAARFSFFLFSPLRIRSTYIHAGIRACGALLSDLRPCADCSFFPPTWPCPLYAYLPCQRTFFSCLPAFWPNDDAPDNLFFFWRVIFFFLHLAIARDKPLMMTHLIFQNILCLVFGHPQSIGYEPGYVLNHSAYTPLNLFILPTHFSTP